MKAAMSVKKQIQVGKIENKGRMNRRVNIILND